MIRRRGTASPPALELLRSLNRLSHDLRRGFTDHTAQQISDTVRDTLGAQAVAVTRDERLTGMSGSLTAWMEEVPAHTQLVLERRRQAKPTVYDITVGREQVHVAVSVLLLDGVPIGTIHVVWPDNAPTLMAELGELTTLIAAQLQLADLEQSRAYAAEAELRALRAQVSPHFLQNALTAIAGLVNRDPVRARSLLVTFSGFLRASFREQTDLTSVAEELRLVEGYLELERARLGDRLRVTLDIAPEALPVRLPFLTVQPIVENAVRHGLEQRPGPGQLRIDVRDAGPEIAIEVEDDGVGIEPDSLERALRGEDPDSHVGILSVDTRLRRTFGPEYGLVIATGERAGTSVTMRLPK